MSSVDTVNTFITALQSGDIELAAGFMADDFVMRGFAPKSLNKNQFLATYSNLLASMPDLSFNMTNEAGEENGTVQIEIEITGTHLNQLAMPVLGVQPIEPTGIAVTLAQTKTIFHVHNEEKVASMEMQSIPGGGLGGLLQQVGAELPLAPRGVNFHD
ncbi:MAG: hypothetical protein NVS4B12_06250 [Ktedonobacteraceae bacterium]